MLREAFAVADPNNRQGPNLKIGRPTELGDIPPSLSAFANHNSGTRCSFDAGAGRQESLFGDTICRLRWLDELVLVS